MDSEPIGSFTLVHDKGSKQAVTLLEGHIFLPLGSELELPGGWNAEVVGMRLLAPNEGEEPSLRTTRFLCLDVRLPDGYPFEEGRPVYPAS
jgi:hypothetical protein